jgi:hypothetical protein
MLEKKRVEFLMSAKKRKRVRKNMKRKGDRGWDLGTRGSRSREGEPEGVHPPPHYMHEFENKRVAKWVPRKCVKRKGRFFLG